MILAFPILVGSLLLKLVSTTFAAVTVSSVAGVGVLSDLDEQRDLPAFGEPFEMTIDNTGTLYVVESENGPIRKIAPNGTVSTLNVVWRPEIIHAVGGIAVDAQNNIFTTNWHSDMIYQTSPRGHVSVYAGGIGAGYLNGPVEISRFKDPSGLAFDHHGNLIVADSINRCIRKISPDGNVSTLAGNRRHGFQDGHQEQARFNFPHGVAVDSFDNVYVADTGNHCVRKISPNGNVSTLAGIGAMGYRDGPGFISRFKYPMGIAVDANGNVFVADSRNYVIRKITPDGIVTTIAGSDRRGFADGPGRSARFDYPTRIVVDNDGNLLVADSGNRRIRKITFTPGDDDDDVEDPMFEMTVPPRPIRYNKDECAICYEVKAADDVYDYCSLGCGHTFHRRCIDRCMTRSTQQRCPMCRSDWILDKPPVAIPTASVEDE